MKKFFFLMALFVAVSTIHVNAQQRMRVSTDAETLMQPGTLGDVPLLLSNMPIEGGKNGSIRHISPVLSGTTREVIISYDLDSLGKPPANSRFLKSLDGTDSVFVGDWKIPISIGDGTGNILYTLKGFGQFMGQLIDNTNHTGKYVIDTLVFAPYPHFNANGAINLTKPVDMYFVYFDNMDVTNPNFAGIKCDFDNTPQLIDQVVIPADSINKRLVANSIKSMVWKLKKPVTIPEGKTFGVMLVPQSPKDSMWLLGQYEWNYQANQTLGSFVINYPTAGVDSIETVWSTGIYYQLAKPTQYPTYYKKPIRTNFRFTFSGLFTQGAVNIKEIEGDASSMSLGISYPNPANGDTHIPFSVNAPSPVSLRLTNVLGQTVMSENYPAMSNGSYSWDINASNLPVGTYIYSMTVGSQTFTRTMSVVR